ncbi:hypothetical protein QYE76_051143 [Lolium multiflorum]|uniref:Uncharacterized protein n=1 Tax=Lolium multiflorum TaxID=4521 RepID=A0AAD8SSJ7_LOLMU|nr:hypothetical protein QYE76_051143 [Lolium multiflorum]
MLLATMTSLVTTLVRSPLLPPLRCLAIQCHCTLRHRVRLHPSCRIGRRPRILHHDGGHVIVVAAEITLSLTVLRRSAPMWLLVFGLDRDFPLGTRRT